MLLGGVLNYDWYKKHATLYRCLDNTVNIS